MDYTETFLVSPAIQLTGGNAATPPSGTTTILARRATPTSSRRSRFYHHRRWQSIHSACAIRGCQLWFRNKRRLISPRTGQAVYFVWSHQLVSFDDIAERRLVADDVSVSITNVAGGVINITNNNSGRRTPFSAARRRSTSKAASVISPTRHPANTSRICRPALLPDAHRTDEHVDLRRHAQFHRQLHLHRRQQQQHPRRVEAQQFNFASSAQRTKIHRHRRRWLERLGRSSSAGPIPIIRPRPSGFCAVADESSGAARMAAVLNHSYRVYASSNAITWSPQSAWLLGFTADERHVRHHEWSGAFSARSRQAFASPIAGTFRVTATQLASINKCDSNGVRAPAGYRILGSANTTSWLPFTTD